MHLVQGKKKLKNKRILQISFLSSLILILFLIQIINFGPLSSSAPLINDNQNINNFDENLDNSAADSILFQGTEEPLNITEVGNLYNNSQEITLNNEEIINLTYYLDDFHNWKVSKIENSIENVQDTRNWVNNSGFKPVTVFNKTNVISYSYDNSGPKAWENSAIISHPGALAMRVHFDYINIEENYDYIRILNNDSVMKYLDTGVKSDFYSPWIKSDELDIDIYSDDLIPTGDYRIDSYEFMNGSSNYFSNSNSWTLNEDILGGTGSSGPGEAGNSTGMFVRYVPYIEWDSDDDTYWAYYNKNDFTEIYQNLTIPRGKLIDAYISFDYNAEYCMETNNIFIYFEINNQKIYSIGMFDIYEAGRNEWHSTGKIYLPLWVNNSNIFENILDNQNLNISIGIKSGISSWYGGFEDRFQQLVWFDNITLGLTSIANSTQDGIDLKIYGETLNNGNEWGQASQTISSNIWDENLIVLNVSTAASELYFELDTTLYGYHNTTTKYNRQYDEGISYTILKNGTIQWEFLHDFAKIDHYSDFEFIISKSRNWEILSARDQANYLRPFEGGRVGDNYLKINKSYSYIGWWTFKATSPNYLNISNTRMYKNGQWVQSSFKTGESTRIKTQVNFSGEIPSNLLSTTVDLKIYHPNGTIWYEESKSPNESGNVTFSEITIGSYNTTGGQYNYTLFWSNGTALGGLKSSFIIIHNSSMTLNRPFDAVNDLLAEGYVGEAIPLKIELKDSENNLPVSEAYITYNWTGGQQIDLEESVDGIYEATIYTDTLDLGTYKFIINSSKLGFVDCNLTLVLNLGEDTKLQRLEYDYYIEFHSNTTIKFQYLDSNDDGIDEAIVKVNISEGYYRINNTGNGIYSVEINTTFRTKVGYFYLNIDFAKGKYESQNRTYQFEIVEQSVNLTVFLNAQRIKENSLFESKFNEEITINASSMAKYDRIYLTEGNLTFICGDYEVNLTKSGSYWFNNSIKILTTYFSLGYNYAYIRFSMDNYQTTIFPFQIIIGQIPIEVLTIDFDDSIDAYIGEDISIEIQLKEVGSNIYIDGAVVSYSWEYGVGTLDGKGSGIYKLDLEIPDDIEEDDYKITLIISKEGSEYKSTEFSFIVDITQEEAEEDPLLFWIIVSVLVAVIGVLAVLSYRSYVLLPRKRRKESDLLARTQRFKDLQNIQAVVIIHKSGGVPVYLKSYSILEHQKKELFSGFIQAITTIGEEISGNKTVISEEEDLKKEERVLEIDFKHFHCLIADKGDIRAIFILREKSSERLRNLVKEFSLYLYSKLKDRFATWDGSLDEFERDIPPILNEHFELFYKEPVKLTKPEIIAKIRKEDELNSMELRILNVIYSLLKGKGKSEFYLDRILELVYEENKDLIIDSIETLIGRKIIIPSTDEKYK